MGKRTQKDIRRSVEALSRVEQAIPDGNAAIHRDAATLSDGQTRPVLVQNPADSGVDAYVSRRIDTDNQITGTIRQNVTVDTAGTTVDKLNADIQDSQLDSTEVVVEQGGSYSGGGANQLPIQTSGVQGQRSTPFVATAQYVIRPGANLLYDITSQANSNDFVIEFAVAERER
ncbi:MAG TPA: hypothetical protein VKP88_03285 [Candidatus Paceibacterota bacterium]|nr:hypothetical protein [Candidatus Paceibacterota bacterium]